MTTRTNGRANALRDEIVVETQATTSASAETVYEVLADLSSHLEWAGTRQRAKARLTSIEAPEGVATVGTEFRTTGNDPTGTFHDASVVTEASRPSVFEFVTEARQDLKKGKTVEWTNVHRYELEPEVAGCTIRYTFRVVRLSRLMGMLGLFKVPVLSSVLRSVWKSVIGRGLRNLARVAEERATPRGEEGQW
jgi:hypothetical protein